MNGTSDPGKRKKKSLPALMEVETIHHIQGMFQGREDLIQVFVYGLYASRKGIDQGLLHRSGHRPADKRIGFFHAIFYTDQFHKFR